MNIYVQTLCFLYIHLAVSSKLRHNKTQNRINMVKFRYEYEFQQLYNRVDQFSKLEWKRNNFETWHENQSDVI